MIGCRLESKNLIGWLLTCINERLIDDLVIHTLLRVHSVGLLRTDLEEQPVELVCLLQLAASLRDAVNSCMRIVRYTLIIISRPRYITTSFNYHANCLCTTQKQSYFS